MSKVDKNRKMAIGVKTGGRTKGIPNRTTAELKEKITAIVLNELVTTETLLKSLEPNERISALIKLLPYIVPKQTEIILENEEEKQESYQNLDLLTYEELETLQTLLGKCRA